ncbi:hypothetical protein V9T40_007457 [Parthenolecanium corni]|uniref:Uncharacterized protein n=1 Tax=Parthenolecanium corni TaxID=536013 RepID=A0AAN9Y4Z0_9HEMI
MAASRARGCCSVAANGPIGPMRLLRPPTAEHQLSTGRLEELPAFVTYVLRTRSSAAAAAAVSRDLRHSSQRVFSACGEKKNNER